MRTLLHRDQLLFLKLVGSSDNCDRNGRQESQEGREEKLKSFKAVEELKNSGQNGVFCEANRRI